MAKRRKVDASCVIEAVNSGRLSRDVMDQFGLDTSEGQKKADPPRRRGRGRPKAEPEEMPLNITVSKRGSLVLSREVLEKLGYGVDEAFIARKTRAGIILKPR